MTELFDSSSSPRLRVTHALLSVSPRLRVTRLRVTYALLRHHVRLGHRTMTLTVRPGSTTATRRAVVHEWHKSLLHAAVRP